MDFDRDYLDEARRYYTNIVGKYGIQVQNVLKKAAALDIQMICPLHGPVWRSNLSYILEKYDIWSKYEAETKGVMIAYASMYGNTENMVNVLAAMLADAGITNIKIHNISKTHVSELISDSFKYSHLVLATNLQQWNLSSDGKLSGRYESFDGTGAHRSCFRKRKLGSAVRKTDGSKACRTEKHDTSDRKLRCKISTA